MQKCLKCGEVTKKGESLCLECRWDNRGLAKANAGGVSGDSSHLEIPTFNEPIDLPRSAPTRKRMTNFDPEALDLLDELVELQKAQNVWAKKTADATGGIFAFFLLSAIGALVWALGLTFFSVM